MGRYVFRLPDVGEGIAEAEIGDWHVAIGSTVREDDPLVDMMTDKATVEITSPVSGTVVALHGAKGDRRPTGSELVVLEVEGAGNAAAGAAADRPAPAAPPAAPPYAPAPAPPVQSAEPARAAATPTPEAFAARPAGGAPQAAPATRRRAHELGIELQYVPGTGPGGRITADDLQAFVDAGRRSPPARSGPARRYGVADVPVIGLRRTIAERLQDTKRRVPHFSYIEEVDVTALEELRTTLNARYAGTQPKLTVLPFLIRAIAACVPEFPMVNALYDDTEGVVHRHAALHAGIATQTANGLVVTVVRHAEALSLWEAAAELTRLSALARTGKAARAELMGSTITVTSLGALGGIATTPIINHPEVAIIGVNKIVERPMVRAGQVAVRTMMNLSGSFDHRVVDGWDAASFIQAMRQRLEMPATLFMDLP